MNIRNKLLIAVCINIFVCTIFVIDNENTVFIMAMRNRYLNMYYEKMENGISSVKAEKSELSEEGETPEIKNDVEIKNTEKINMPKTIDVVLTSNDSIYFGGFTIKSESDISIKNGEEWKSLGKKVSSDEIENHFVGKSVELKSDSGFIIEGKSEYIYEGKIRVYKENHGYVLVNATDFERYVMGVVSSEMPEAFETEAKKAQAVCARTYILSRLNDGKYKKYGAVCDDTTGYQVFGKNKISQSMREAVESTRGQVLLCNDKLICTYFFSTSCGITADWKVWGNKKCDYLVSRYIGSDEMGLEVSTGDYFKKFIDGKYNAYEKECNYYRWSTEISYETIKNNIYKLNGTNVGDIKSLEINHRNAGGIVSELSVYGENIKYVLTNQNEIRKILASEYSELKLNNNRKTLGFSMLPSAFFYLDNKNNGVSVVGGGYGHGVGMSQNGANEMAKCGIAYDSILKSFFANVELVRFE